MVSPGCEQNRLGLAGPVRFFWDRLVLLDQPIQVQLGRPQVADANAEQGGAAQYRRIVGARAQRLFN